MKEFRGLASVVEAWRDVRENEWMTIDEMDRDTGFRRLVEILNMADEYMVRAESEQPINEAASVPSQMLMDPDAFDMSRDQLIDKVATTGQMPTTQPVQVTDDRGMFHKYTVHRNDNMDMPGLKHHACPLFVLDLRHDPAARVAARRYAQAASHTHPKLAEDLLALVDIESRDDHGPVSADDTALPKREPQDPPVGLMLERQCNGGMNHHGHKWQDPLMGMESVWCNGVMGIAYG